MNLLRNVFIFVAAISFAVAIATAAKAESLIASGGSTTVVLTTDPCVSEKVLKQLKPAFHEKYRRADVTHEGEHIDACYMPFLERGYIFILDENGETGAVSTSAFKPVDLI